jgi:type IV pilus assembly protein PilA
MNRARGYSMLEILIVLTIISILAVVAVPMYLNYDVRAKVSEGLVMVRPVEHLVEEYYETNGKWPLTFGAAGMGAPTSYKTQYVASIGITFNTINSSDFKLRLTYSIPTLGANNTLIFLPTVSANGAIQWDCTGGTLLDKYRPPVCRS